MVDITAIGGKLLRSPARGFRYGAAAGRGSRPGQGPATSRQRRAELVADGTDSGPKGRPGPVPWDVGRLVARQVKACPAGRPHVARQPPLLAGGVPCDVHAEMPGAGPGM